MKISMHKIFISFLMGLGLLLSTHVQAEVTIVMVRHAEKQEADLGQLTCQGLNRALKLGPLLTSRFGQADEIFAPNPSVKISMGSSEWFYVRPLATIEPYAIRSNLPVNTGYGWNDTKPVVDQLLARQQGLVILAWEHHEIMAMANEILSRLGSSQETVPKWHDNDFDRIFVFKIATAANSKSSLASFQVLAQGLNGQPMSCPE